MPLEVREIGISLSVGDPEGPSDASPEVRGAAPLGGAERDAIVEQCTRAVLDELKRRGER